MGKARERLFFGLSEMTAWKFGGINMLNALNLLRDRKVMHGRALQQLLWELFDETWTPGNDLTYTILNTYEGDGYVRSSWEGDDDPDKRYIRGYVITDRGLEYLKTVKPSFSDTLVHMQDVFTTSLDLLWGNRRPQEETQSANLISSSKFTTLNLLKLLSEYTGQWLYAKEIKKKLSSSYNGLWEPSDGVLYPLLSRFSTNGYLLSSWSEDSKKRSIREYSITSEGEVHLARLLSLESGLKNKIIQLESLCAKSNDFISGNSTANISKILNILARQAS